MPGLLAARIAAVLLLGVAAFQLLLALGAPWGSWTQGGANAGVLPAGNRVLAAVSCALLVVMAFAILARAGSGPFRGLPRGVVTFLAWATTVYAGLGVLLNLATPSAVERAAFAPLTAVVLVCCVVVLRATRRRRAPVPTS
jgi:hypothetical protein